MQEQDPNHDKGYGVRASCTSSIALENEQDWQRHEKFVALALNPTNRQTFLLMELPLRRGIILKMIEEGMITYSLKPSNHCF